MAFHEREFLLIFFPIFVFILSVAYRSKLVCVSVGSLVYIALAGWMDFGVISLSIAANFILGRLARGVGAKLSKVITYSAILLNLGLMVFGKKFLPTHGGLIPLGISFYSFEQIAFHIDSRKRKFAFPSFMEYVFFVSFFPHLVAGPLIRAGDMFRQIRGAGKNLFSLNLSLANLALLGIGLAKKVLLADMLRPYVEHAFTEAAFADSRLGTVHLLYATAGYGLQIYFDFSGYSDMAIAFAAILGIQLPWNFDSPLKSQSIAEFWRRWHMTLASFIREYLYDPLKEKVRNPAVQKFLVVPVMGVLGLWHGFSWGFLVWGLAHGSLLLIHRIWRSRKVPQASFVFRPLLASLITMLFVYGLCPLFKGASAASIVRLYKGGVSWDPGSYGTELSSALFMLLIAGAVAHFAPNSNQIRVWVEELENSRIHLAVSTTVLVLMLCGIAFSDYQSAFIYFKF